MPAPGEQHSSIANPFEEVKPRVSEFTAQEIAALQSRLEKQLGPEYLSARTGPSGQKVHYIAAEKCIALANEVFGFNGWSSSIQNIQVDFVDEHPQTMKISLGLSVIMRVTLRDGTFHEDIGYGHIENCKGKAAAFEKAKKEGTTDALKRALRNFGNVLGNCIYDKTYLQKVTKMKVEPLKFNESGLHRHADYSKKEPVVVKAEPAASIPPAVAHDSFEDLLEGFDEADFCVPEDEALDDDIMSELMLIKSNDSSANRQVNGSGNGNGQLPMQPPARPLASSVSAGNPSRGPQTPNQHASRTTFLNSDSRQQAAPQNQVRPNAPQNSNHYNGNQPVLQGQTGAQPGAIGAGANGPPPGSSQLFFSARAVASEILAESDKGGAPIIPREGQVFNPKAESPSIRKTPGIDHTTSKPLARNGQHIAPSETPSETPGASNNGTAGAAFGSGSTSGSRPAQQPAARSNPVNPQFDQARRIGAPGGSASPLANRGQYRPPTMKRPLPTDAGGAATAPGGRAPLMDVSNNGLATAVGANAAATDVKRQKMS